MSFSYYGKMWIATKNDLENVLLREKVLPKLQPTRDRSYTHRLIGNIYARYIVLCNNLSELYDQTLQVQKRQVIEKILMSSTNRLMELQLEMQKIEMSEFIYADDTLLELKLTPQNIEFLRPFYFPRKRDVEVQLVIDEIVKVPEEVEETEAPKGLDKYRKVLTPEEMEAQRIYREKLDGANLIKIHEKGKQARINWFNVNDFPEKFKPKRRELPTVAYEFMHKPDQIPMYKIKRTNYHTDLYRPKVNIGKFTFYEPPVYRENKLGQLVIVPRKKSEIVTQVDEIEEESDSDEDEKTRQIEEENKLETERQAQVEKQKSAAALIIQRCFRRYLKKKALMRENWKRMEICGVVVALEDHDKPDQKSIDEQMRQKRRERKKEFDESFLKALEDEKARIIKLKTEFIMEDITDDIRQWFREFYDAANDFHRYPEEFEGGTIMVLREETMTPEEFLVEKAKTPAQVAKDKAEKKKRKKEEKKTKKKEAAQKKKEEKARKILEKKQGPTWNFADKKFESKNFGKFFFQQK
jgi:IQ and AAA domain-containing protein